MTKEVHQLTSRSLPFVNKMRYTFSRNTFKTYFTLDYAFGNTQLTTLRPGTHSTAVPQ